MAPKREADDAMDLDSTPHKNHARPPTESHDDDPGAFEDDYEDEYESDPSSIHDELASNPDDDGSSIFEAGADGQPDPKKPPKPPQKKIFLPNRHKLAAGEHLAPDPSTYDMLHALSASWPCLSLDIIRDQLGEGKSRKYPHTVYAIAGTQADAKRSRENKLLVMKLSSLSRMDRNRDAESSDEDSDSDAEDADPVLETRSVPQSSTTNRIRAWQAADQSKVLAASMMESGALLVHDVTPHLTSFDTPGTVLGAGTGKPLSVLKPHARTEGYALDWTPASHSTPKLLSGDNRGDIYITSSSDSTGSAFTVENAAQPFTGHDGSVEDLHWSPNERTVFASAGSDGTVKIWDTRSKTRKPAISVQVSRSDVNVISWSRHVSHLLASGHDDGSWSVWDLRKWKPSAGSGATGSGEPPAAPVASFAFHADQITSLQWHPTEDSIVLAASADNTVTLWDLAVEVDDEEGQQEGEEEGVPAQLLFVHWMEEVKEARWVGQIPGAVVATGGGGFGVFKTISI